LLSAVQLPLRINRCYFLPAEFVLAVIVRLLSDSSLFSVSSPHLIFSHPSPPRLPVRLLRLRTSVPRSGPRDSVLKLALALCCVRATRPVCRHFPAGCIPSPRVHHRAVRLIRTDGTRGSDDNRNVYCGKYSLFRRFTALANTETIKVYDRLFSTSRAVYRLLVFGVTVLWDLKPLTPIRHSRRIQHPQNGVRNVAQISFAEPSTERR
jgi:hypothetical protein